ncbi:MAG: hypothetical protein HY234_01530 [Acidobacteria bacterium]|nr:hypothetical protein [Acidobacteriota bacterium]
MTYLERIKKRFENNPVVAWSVIAASVVLTLAAVVSTLKPVVQQVTSKPDSVPLSIVMEAYDPRFRTGPGSDLLNWGGGSQGLFIETTSEIRLPAAIDPAELGNARDPVTEFTMGLLARLKAHKEIARVWEVVPGGKEVDGMRVKVQITYDAGRDAPPCIIREWGVITKETPPPKLGLLIKYQTGGAYVAPVGGLAEIEQQAGTYPIQLWMEENEKSEDYGRAIPKQYTQYLNPGEVVTLDISVRGKAEDVLADDPRPNAARQVRVYAKVLVAGKEWQVLSKNLVRVVFLDGTNSSQLDYHNDVEQLRPLAYSRE